MYRLKILCYVLIKFRREIRIKRRIRSGFCFVWVGDGSSEFFFLVFEGF